MTACCTCCVPAAQCPPDDIAEALSLGRYPVRHALDRLRGRGLVRVAGMAARRAPRWGEGGPVGIWEATPTE